MSAIELLLLLLPAAAELGPGVSGADADWDWDWEIAREMNQSRPPRLCCLRGASPVDDEGVSVTWEGEARVVIDDGDDDGGSGVTSGILRGRAV